MLSYRSLICLSLLHCVVDTYAMLIEPLWPKLSHDLRLSPWSQWLLLTTSMLAVNFSQPLFGYFRDRWNTTACLWIGPLVGVILIPLMGLVSHVTLLCAVLTIGLIGIGSFHPEGVITAGTVLPGHRTRGISIFLLGGTLGLGLGPLIGGYCVQTWGLSALSLLIIPGIALVVAFEIGGRPGYPPRPPHSEVRRVPMSQFLREHGRQAALLLLVSTCRVLPGVGIPKAVAFTLAQQRVEAGLIGVTQSIFLSAGSLGMLWLAGRFQHGSERRHLIIDPLVALPLIVGLALFYQNFAITAVLLALTGLILNGTTAAVISYGHQLFPHSTGIASSLTMGFAWGLSGLVVASLTTIATQNNHPEWMYWAFLPFLLLSSLLALWLPQPATAEASDNIDQR